MDPQFVVTEQLSGKIVLDTIKLRKELHPQNILII